MKLATAYYELIPSTAGAQGDITRQFGGIGQSASKSFGNSFSRGLKAAIGPALAVVGTAAVASFFKSSVDGASDLNETLNLNQVIFKKDAKAMVAWSQTSDSAFGLSQQSALQATGQFGDMFNQLGFGRKASVKMSQQVVQLAADLGSFKNLETEDVLERISAGFRGEYDSLQLLIPAITAARVEKEAMAATGKKTAESLTAEEKAAATLAIIQKDGASAAGDFAETSDGLANSQKILAAEFDNAKAELGEGLLPVAADFVHFLSDEGVPAVEKFAGWFTETGVPALRDFGNEVGPLAKSTLPALNTSFGITRDLLADAAPLVKSIVDSFNSLPSGVQTAIVLGGGAAVLGGKVKSGVGAAVAAAGGGVAATTAKKGGGGLGAGLLLAGTSLANVKDQADTYSRLTQDMKDSSGSLAKTFTKDGTATKKSFAEVKKEFESGRVGKYADDLGVDLDRLSKSFTQNGIQGKYVQETLQALDGKYSKSKDIFDDAFGHLTGQTESSKIAGFSASLRALGDQYQSAGDKAYGSGNQTRDLTALMLGNNSSARRLAQSYEDLGRKDAKPKVSTPGLGAAVGGVIGLSRNLDNLDKKVARPRVDLGGSAGAQIGAIGAALDRLGRKKKALEIPGNARGTNDWRGGLSLVGERGPELVNLPKHSQVLPADLTRSAMSSSPGSQLAAQSAGSADGLSRGDIERLIAAVEAGQEIKLDGRTFAYLVQDANRRLR